MITIDELGAGRCGNGSVRYSAIAKTLPIPLVPPVTRAVLPLKPKRDDRNESMLEASFGWVDTKRGLDLVTPR